VEEITLYTLQISHRYNKIHKNKFCNGKKSLRMDGDHDDSGNGWDRMIGRSLGKGKAEGAEEVGWAVNR